MNGVDKPGSVKAQIVKALKAMLNSVQHLSQVVKSHIMTFLFFLLIEFNKFILNKVESILNKSKIWKDYKDQKHDLFISNTTAIGYLTNSVPSVAGKLLSSIKLFY